MLLTMNIIIVLSLFTFLFMQCAPFGKIPNGERLDRIKKSPNFKDGEFKNLIPTEVQSPNTSTWKMIKDYYNRSDRTVPPKDVPSIKIDLKNLSGEKPTIVWFGHSSYLIKIKDKNILVDPVFSGYSSPFSFLVKAFKGSDLYKVEDFPKLDLVIISHDHYDHLDHQTILKIQSIVGKFVVPLGVGSHLEHWGISAEQIIELDWWENKEFSKELKITATPARHFSGRAFARFKTLWASYALELYGYKIFIGGDSGYDESFKKIGDAFNGFDIAMLEAGQYNESWPTIHMFPEETVNAAIDLKAKVLLPVHWGKFELSLHEWNDSVKRVTKSASEKKQKVTTPIIGELILLNSIYPNSNWWDF